MMYPIGKSVNRTDCGFSKKGGLVWHTVTEDLDESPLAHSMRESHLTDTSFAGDITLGKTMESFKEPIESAGS